MELADETGLIDNHIVKLPFIADQMELVGDRYRLAGPGTLGLGFGEVRVYALDVISGGYLGFAFALATKINDRLLQRREDLYCQQKNVFN
ncbi:MAG TPA: hypothetical protein VGA09_12875 [Candidatus Binatia bacterium]